MGKHINGSWKLKYIETPYKRECHRLLTNDAGTHLAYIAVGDGLGHETDQILAMINCANRMKDAIETVLFCVTDDADNNDGKVDRAALYQLCKQILSDINQPPTEKRD